jgi:hypothetical protein
VLLIAHVSLATCCVLAGVYFLVYETCLIAQEQPPFATVTASTGPNRDAALSIHKHHRRIIKENKLHGRVVGFVGTPLI